jgi:hypothetical protein
MNPTTEEVIQFLNHPELNFGTEEDLLLLADPEAFQAEVARLLQEPTLSGKLQAESLR